jgi:PAS domain S-box-containing protein
VNEAVARLFGYAPHEIIGQRALAFIAPEARAEADANVQAGLEQPYESIGLRKNGSRFPIEVYGRAIECDGQTMRVIAVRDLTFRKLAEEALRQAEERYRLAVRATNDAIWDWDIETGRTLFNEAIGTLFGYDENEATTLDWWVDRIHPDDRTRVVKGIKAAVNGRVECWNDEYRFLRADRSWADVVDRAIIVRDPDGKAIRMIGAMLDLTERKLMEAALRHAVERNQALLREANHRIKNNLQFVSSLLGVQRGALRDPEARSALNEARRRIQAMSRVHERFYKTGEFDCAEFGEILRALRDGLVSGAEGEPDIVVAAPVCPVPGDMATPLALIANELMTNAIKHAFAPGLRGTVTVSCAIDHDGSLVLTVADDGCGLPPGFDLAGQAGFGLRLVQMMARQIRGEVLVRNGNPGTVVEVRVPPKRAA